MNDGYIDSRMLSSPTRAARRARATSGGVGARSSAKAQSLNRAIADWGLGFGVQGLGRLGFKSKTREGTGREGREGGRERQST